MTDEPAANSMSMSDDRAAIKATFSDFRLIKGRKQAQLVLEVPIEEADKALAVLGGIPQPQSDRWVAVARLNGVAKPEPEPGWVCTKGGEPGTWETTSTAVARQQEKRKWDDLKLSMQAGIRCQELPFLEYLKERFPNGNFPNGPISNAWDAADAVRLYCGVDSRSGLNTNPDAAERWRLLDRSYQAWLKAVE